MTPAEPSTAAVRPHPVNHDRAVVHLHDAAVRFGDRQLWSGLDMDVAPGEFIAVLGANGSGKTTLLRVLLGQQPLAAGVATIVDRPVHRGSRLIGYVPQQKSLETHAAIRGRDLVGFGLDGDRWGFTLPSRRRRAAIDRALESVHATAFADAPLGQLSGGEQQRLRIAQALVTNPRVLLCDEPLLALDLAHQQTVVDLIDEVRRERDVAVLFVTHEINPVLPLVDRVVYIAGGDARIGTVDEVMTSESLSQMYGAPVEVIRREDRLIVIGTEASPHHDHHLHDLHCPPEEVA